MIRIVIYLHDLLILGNSMSETFTARHSVIFLLQHLGFMINLKKCVLDPVQEIEFLWLIVNFLTMTLSLPEKKIGKIKDQCLSLYKASEVSLLDLSKLIETLSSTIQSVLPAHAQQYAKYWEETRNRPVCIKVIKSASKLLLLEPGSQKS